MHEQPDRLRSLCVWPRVHVLRVRPSHLEPAGHVPHLPPADQGRDQDAQGDWLRS